MVMMKQACRSCRYYNLGSCYRYPPVIVTVRLEFPIGETNELSDVRSERPHVREKDLCGEWVRE